LKFDAFGEFIDRRFVELYQLQNVSRNSTSVQKVSLSTLRLTPRIFFDRNRKVQIPQQTMENIDEERLEVDLKYRYEYITKFVGFGANDISILQEHKEFLTEIIPKVVYAVTEKRMLFDVTKKLLLGRIYGYKGELQTDIDEMDMNSEIIVARLAGFTRVVTTLLSAPWDEVFVTKVLPVILVWRWGNKLIEVALVHNNVSFSLLQDQFFEHIMSSNLEKKSKFSEISHQAMQYS
jgi:hypothetical protein